MSRYPEPTVGALIFNPQDQILLVKSYKWKNHYVIPGGHIELGEKIEDALRREVWEETGLKVSDIHLLGLQECVYDKSFHEKKHFIFIDFRCRSDSSEVILNDEHQDYIWTDLNKIDRLPLEPFTKKLLTEYRAEQDSAYLRKILYDYF